MGLLVDPHPNTYKKRGCCILAVDKSPCSWVIACLSYKFVVCQWEISVCSVDDHGFCCLAALSWDSYDSSIYKNCILTWKNTMNQIVVILNGYVKVFSVDWYDIQSNCKLSALETTLAAPSRMLDDSPIRNSVFVKLDLVSDKSLGVNTSYSVILDDHLFMVGNNKLYLFSLSSFSVVGESDFPAYNIQSNVDAHEKQNMIKFSGEGDCYMQNKPEAQFHDIKLITWLKSVKIMCIIFSDGSFIFCKVLDHCSPCQFQWSSRQNIVALVGYPMNSNQHIPCVYEKYGDSYCSALVTKQDLDQYLDISEALHDKLCSKRIVNGLQQREMVQVLSCVGAHHSTSKKSMWEFSGPLSDELVFISKGTHFHPINNCVGHEGTSRTYSISKFTVNVNGDGDVNLECLEWINICNVSSDVDDDVALQIIHTTRGEELVLLCFMGKLICKSLDKMSQTIFQVETNFLYYQEVSHFCVNMGSKLFVSKSYSIHNDDGSSSKDSLILLYDLFEDYVSTSGESIVGDGKKILLFSPNAVAAEEPRNDFLKHDKLLLFPEVKRTISVIEFPGALHSKYSSTPKFPNSAFTHNNMPLVVANSGSQRVFHISRQNVIESVLSQQVHGNFNHKCQCLGYLVCCYDQFEFISSCDAKLLQCRQTNVWLYNYGTKRWKSVFLPITSSTKLLEIQKNQSNNQETNQTRNYVVSKSSLNNIDNNFFVLHVNWFKTHSIFLFTKRNNCLYFEVISRKCFILKYSDEACPRVHRLIPLPIGFSPVFCESFTIIENSPESNVECCIIGISDGLHCICFQVTVVFQAEASGQFFQREVDECGSYEHQVIDYKIIELWNIQLNRMELRQQDSKLKVDLSNSKVKDFKLFFCQNKKPKDVFVVDIIANFYNIWGVFCIDPLSKTYHSILEDGAHFQSRLLSHKFYLLNPNIRGMQTARDDEIVPYCSVLIQAEWHPVIGYEKSVFRTVNKHKVLKTRLKVLDQNHFSLIQQYQSEIHCLTLDKNNIIGKRIVGLDLSCDFYEIADGFLLSIPRYFEGEVYFMAASLSYIIYLGMFESKLRLVGCEDTSKFYGDLETSYVRGMSFESSCFESDEEIATLTISSIPAYSLSFRYFIYSVETLVVRLLGYSDNNINNRIYQLFSAYLFSASPSLHSEIFTKLTRKLEPNIVKLMFPLSYAIDRNSYDTKEWKCYARSLCGLFEMLLSDSSSYQRSFIFANRILSVVCQVLGGSDSHAATSACLLLAIQLFCANMMCLSCTNMIECLNFILRLENINSECCIQYTSNLNGEETVNSYLSNIVGDVLGCIVDNEANSACEKSEIGVASEDSTLWGWVWSLLGPVAPAPDSNSERVKSQIKFEFEGRNFSDAFKQYSVVNLLKGEYFCENENGLNRLLTGFEKNSLFIMTFSAFLRRWTIEHGSDLSMALILLFCLTSATLQNIIKTFLMKNSPSLDRPFGASDRVEKLAMILRLHKHKAWQQAEQSAEVHEVLDEFVSEQFLRRLIDLEMNEGSNESTVYYDLFGEYYGNEFNNYRSEHCKNASFKSNVFSKWEIWRSLIVGYLLTRQPQHAISAMLLCWSIFPKEIQVILIQIKLQSATQKDIELLNLLILNFIFPAS